MDGWVDGFCSWVKDCLQQSKISAQNIFQIYILSNLIKHCTIVIEQKIRGEGGDLKVALWNPKCYLMLFFYFQWLSLWWSKSSIDFISGTKLLKKIDAAWTRWLQCARQWSEDWKIPGSNPSQGKKKKRNILSRFWLVA